MSGWLVLNTQGGIEGAFVAKIANTLLKKICMAIFALAERLSTSATLELGLEIFKSYVLIFGKLLMSLPYISHSLRKTTSR